MRTSGFKALCIAALFSVGFIGACNNDDDGGGGGCGSFSWATEVESEFTALFETALAYGSDPTTANCERYKSAFRDYVDALDGLENCLGVLSAQDRQDYNEALKDAEDELNNLPC